MLSRRSFLAGIGAAMAQSSVLGAGGGEGMKRKIKPNVIWVVNDSARAANHHFHGYERPTTPVLDEFAAGSTMFEHCFSQGYWTRVSVSTYMSGRYFPVPCTNLVKSGQAVFLGEPVQQTLAPVVFQESGYDTCILSGNGAYVSEDSRLYQSFQEFLPEGRESFEAPVTGWKQVSKNTLRSSLSTIDGWLARRSTKPFFLYLHLMDSHSPFGLNEGEGFDTFVDWNYRGANVRDFQGATAQRAEPGIVRESDREILTALYDGALKQFDTAFGNLLEILHRQKLWDDTIVIYTSDHGEMLYDDLRTWGHNGLYGGPDETCHVPLLVGGGPVKKNRVTQVVESIDILPTLVSTCELKLNPYKVHFDGDVLSKFLEGSADDIAPLANFAVTKLGDPQEGGIHGLNLSGPTRRVMRSYEKGGDVEYYWRPDSVLKGRHAAEGTDENFTRLKDLADNIRESTGALAERVALPFILYLPFQKLGALEGFVPESYRVISEADGLPPQSDGWYYVQQKSGKGALVSVWLGEGEAPALDFRIPVSLRDRFRLYCELGQPDNKGLTVEPIHSYEAASWETEMAGSFLFPPEEKNGLSFVCAGGIEAKKAGRLTLRLRLQDFGVCEVRSFLLVPDVEGSQEQAINLVSGESFAEQQNEKALELEALGYL